MIQPRFVVEQLAGSLGQLGFRQVSRSVNGSRYFTAQRSQFQMRVSDHPMQGRNDHVVLSWIVREPMEIAMVEDLALMLALKFVLRSRLRLGLVREEPRRRVPIIPVK